MKLNPVFNLTVKPSGVTGLIGGGDEPKEKLTPQKMKEWNMFIDWMKTKGHSGSTKLDKDKTLGQSLFNQFKKDNPSTTITYDIVPAVQTEFQRLKNDAQNFAARRNDPNAKNIMSNVSKVDGFLGSQTSQFSFPDMVEKEYKNDALVGANNLGLVKGGLQPTGVVGNSVRKAMPSGVKLEPLYDDKGKQTGMGYTDENGDLIKVN